MKDDFAELFRPDEADPPAEPSAPTPPDEAADETAELDPAGKKRKAGLRVRWGIPPFLRHLLRKDSMLRLTIVLTLITVIVAGLLGLVHFFTSDIIAENKDKATNTALSKVFPGQTLTFSPVPEEPDAYVARDGSQALVGYAISVTTNGYGGTISMVVGIDLDGRVTGIEVIGQRESRGFDNQGNFNYANGTSFLEGFVGNRGPFELGRDIDAVSGATVSSKAVAAGVSEAAVKAEKLLAAGTEDAGGEETP